MPQGRSATMPVLDLVGLTRLMALSGGRAEVSVGLIDGPVASSHPALAAAHIRMIGPGDGGGGAALSHGTFVAGLLAAGRDGAGPKGICPGCTILVRPIFGAEGAGENLPGSTAEDLATAIVDCAKAGARVVNISAALAEPSPNAVRGLERAVDFAAQSGCILVVAAGNQGAIGTTALTRHPWVVPVTACDEAGRPLAQSNFSGAIGRGGIAAPGARVTSLAAGGGTIIAGGTSAAAPFVTGTVALIASLLPRASGTAIRYALSQPGMRQRNSIVPPLLDAWASYRSLAAGSGAADTTKGNIRHADARSGAGHA